MHKRQDGSAGRLAGRRILITGGARGQGANHAKAMAKEGGRVLIGDIDGDAAHLTAGALRGDGLDVHAVRLDVAHPKSWDACMAVCAERLGGLDVLINNAGIFPASPLMECSLDEWEKVVSVNQTGPFIGIQKAVPLMRGTGVGSIINIISVAGVLATEIAVAYAVSKAALLMLTRTAALSLAPDIRVNAITPGIIDTDMMRQLDPERLKVRLAAYPMRRAGTVDEVSEAAIYLASDASSYTTGAELRVDGGATAGIRAKS
ncbi:MAG: SDR family oxidoreductase [Rhodobiaceae bacterium]|nr:SDR family oxidoreductase [Rhodobiaceae bacterium]